MQCKVCKHENEDTASVCANCGAELQKTKLSTKRWLPFAIAGGVLVAIALIVAIVPMFTGGPGATAGSKSGDAELDAMLEEIVSTKTGTGEDALQKAFDYMSEYLYISQNELPEGDWTTWSVPYAKEMCKNREGNCYRYASLFCWIARYLGYDAKVISGRIPWQAELAPHAWVEIRVDGEVYVCDSDMHKFKPHLALFMVTYDEAPYEFHRVDGSLYTNANANE